MRKHLVSALSAAVLVVLLGVALAGEPDKTTIQSGSTITETYNGQTFEMTAINVVVEVTFLSVTENGVTGRVTMVGGQTGTFTIHWVEGATSETIALNPSHLEQLFGLEGGDGDKRSVGEVN